MTSGASSWAAHPDSAVETEPGPPEGWSRRCRPWSVLTLHIHPLRLLHVAAVGGQRPDDHDVDRDQAKCPTRAYTAIHTKAEIALTMATMTPTVRASTLPENTPNPEKNTTAPMSKCNQPHFLAVVSKSESIESNCPG